MKQRILLWGIVFVCLLSVGFMKPSNDDRPLAVILKYKPDVLLKGAHENEWREAVTAQELYGRDTVKTDSEGFALVRFMDMSMARLRPDSYLIIQGEVLGKGSTKSNIVMNKGEMLMDVIGRKSRFEIQTPSAVATVLGTSFITKVEEDGSSNYTGISGTVELVSTKTGETVQLKENQFISISYTLGEVKLEPMQAAQVNQLKLNFTQLDMLAKPKFIELKLIDKNGKVQFIEIPYYEKND